MKASLLVLFGAALLLPLAAGLSGANEPERWGPGVGGAPADIEREVLWLDNPDFSENVASSEVIGQFGLWTEVANDFVLTTDVSLRKVTWWGEYWNGYEGTPTGSGFNLRFYMPDADCLPEDAPFIEYMLPGNDCCESYAEGGNQYTQYVYEFCLELPLLVGTYWFSAQMADHEFPPQWGRLGADRVRVCLSVFRSPYFSYPDWEPDTWFLYEASQMFEDVCHPTALTNTTWGAVRQLYR